MEGLTKNQQRVYDEFTKHESAQRPIDICVSIFGHTDSAYIFGEIKALVRKGYLKKCNEGSTTKYKAI